MNSKVIIWDFDGVIADTFGMCFELIRTANPDLTEEEYRKRFEGNINAVKEEKKEKKKIDFFDQYEAHILDQKLVEGIADVIRILSDLYPMVIVSSTINKPIKKYLEHHNLRKYFKEILGNDVAESKVEKLKMVLEKFEVSAEDCVFITDTLGDIQEGEKVGIKSISVPWGFHAKETLEKGEPEVIVEKPAGITQAVSEILGN